jgi:hypothetical protein
MGHDPFPLANESRPTQRDEWQVVFGQPQWRPFNGVRELCFDTCSQDAVRIDSHTFSSQVCHSPFGRTPNTDSLDVPVVRCQDNTEAVVKKKIGDTDLPPYTNNG